IFNSNPVGFHATQGFGPGRAALAGPFVVNAATTPGGGNFPGFCSGINPSAGRAATAIFGLGQWASGDCAAAAIGDSDVGVNLPQDGQVGNLTVDAGGHGNGAADGTVGLNSTASGQLQTKIIHADGTETITTLSCTLGVSTGDAKVHCEDK